MAWKKIETHKKQTRREVALIESKYDKQNRILKYNRFEVWVAPPEDGKYLVEVYEEQGRRPFVASEWKAKTVKK